MADGYTIESELETLLAEEKQLIARASGVEDVDQLRGQIKIIQKDVRSLGKELDAFDFASGDERVTRSLVEDIDARIVQLNEIRYSLESDKSQIEAALGTRLSINLKALEKLFKESQVYFSDQVKKDYSSLENFNRALAEERDAYLQSDLEEIESQLEEANSELELLNRKRATALASLTDSKSISKYKRLSKELVTRQTDLEALKRMEGLHKEIESKRRMIRDRKRRLDKVRNSLKRLTVSPPSRHDTIREYLDEIVFQVINRHANLFARVNNAGHLEFSVEVLGENRKPSSAGDGFSYGRLLCVAFDLAIMRAYIDEPFPHFVFHDGLLETLDDRKKVNLIQMSREYCNLGIQHIVTVIDSELPHLPKSKRFEFEPDEIILSLSDVGNKGRLFKMPAW